MKRVFNWLFRREPDQTQAPSKMRCKPGDLAFITHDPNCSGRDLGKVVLVERLSPSQFDSWDCTSKSGLLIFFLDDGSVTEGLNGFIPDAWLQPIRADGVSDGEVESLYSPRPAPAKESA